MPAFTSVPHLEIPKPLNGCVAAKDWRPGLPPFRPEKNEPGFTVLRSENLNRAGPLLEAYREKYPGVKIVLTFFSPSGYEVRKNYAGADYIFYLPMDGPSSSLHFIGAVNPRVAFFVKYDFWHYYLRYLRAQDVPVYFVSAAFRPDQAFFRWYGGFFRKMLRCVNPVLSSE
jgi:3-deoxy-D-manno-octulosonic-acid transferase